MSVTLGQKIRFFRKREGLSQLELENAIGTSSGSVSRMENNQTNPTKESLLQISDILKLDLKEQNYLIGLSSELVSAKDIEFAKKDVAPLFESKESLAYLLDDRARLISISKGFINLFGLDKNLVDKFIEKSFISFVLNPSSKIMQYLSPSHIEDTFFNMLSKFYADTNFILEDEYIEQSIESINSLESARKLWELVKANNNYRYQSNKERTVVFVINGKEYEVIYTVAPLLKQRRFDLVEYTIGADLKLLLEGF